MKVYLDCSPLTNTQVSGIGVYNKNLFLELARKIPGSVFPVLKWSRLGKADIVKGHIGQDVRALPPFLFNKDVVYHGTDHKLNTRSFGPKVVTIHDMQPFVGQWMDPQFAKDRIEIMTKTLESDVQKIIAISHFTAQEIVRFFPKAAPLIEVVYHGYNFEVSPTALNQEESVIKKISNDRPFLFFVGNIEERKNLINQIKAFHILKEKNKDLIFILAGKAGFNFQEIEKFINSSPYKSDIFITGYLSDADKDYALKHTSCLMFASWYEGFGLPLLEALSKNTNVIISETSSLKEIGHKYCYQCDPSSPEDIALKTAFIMEKGNLQKVDLESFKEEWSWKKCALETIEVYKSAHS